MQELVRELYIYQSAAHRLSILAQYHEIVIAVHVPQIYVADSVLIVKVINLETLAHLETLFISS